MIQTSDTLYRNNNLFSNYYFEKYLPDSLEWKKKDHIEAFEQIKNIFSRESGSIKTLNEKQLENHFFNEIFSILGFVFEVTEPTHARNFPDYAFFFDRNGLDDAHKNKETISFFANAVAIGEVKQWKVDLDKVSKNEYNISENPSLQIWTYLEDTEQKWGILSNGRIWRLYCKERRRDNYLEIDLSRLIESNDISTFRFFYYFFRKDAFVKSKEGQAFLDRILNESKDYAQKIGDDLKDNVYWAMKRIAEGFVNQKSNHLDSHDPATLSRIQNNTMILLYRFLFLLYAEGKGLLDLNDQRYREYYSFHHIKHYIAEIQDGPVHQRFDTVKSSIQSDLKDLFKLVDQGSESFGIPKTEYYIPAYNGGLFDPDKHPDLEHWEIGDKYLADAIDLLSRSKPKEGHRDFVDYSTLEIRNLGSIYEGLLEYKLKVAESDLVVSDGGWATLDEYNVNRKQKKTITDFSENDRVTAGHLYLTTDKGERKSTGSYYTPDYIVNYIVKNTIGPVVEKKWKDAQVKGESCIDATLSINVLDPAMGSGHFLVGAVDFLSQKLLEAVQKDFEAGKIADTAPYTNDWARRDIVSHCIYGVDLNELAVELAKVGLWLTTISRDKPLSFLDHRLKQGNSLIGARLTNLRYYPGKEPKERNQTVLPTSISPRFIGPILAKIAELDAIEDNRLEDIIRKEKAFEEFKQLPEYQKAKGLANVYTATYFGNVITPTEKKPSEALYQDLVWAIAGDEKEWQSKTWYPWFKQASTIAYEKSFFSWELEFPEIFFDAGKLRENPGWDAVIGNPPYIRDRLQEESLESYYYSVQFSSAFQKFDIYALFVEKGINLLTLDGRLGYIIPNKFMATKYAVPLRKILLNDTSIKTIVDVSLVNVFPNVSVYPHIIVIQRSRNEKNFVDFQFVKEVKNNTMVYSKTTQIPQKLFIEMPDLMIISSLNDKTLQTLNKMKSNATPLGILCNINEGIHTGNLRQNLIAQNKVNDKTHPLFIGENIGRYESIWNGLFIIYDWSIIKTTPKGYGSLRDEKIFSSDEKIICREIHTRITCTYDNERKYFLNHLYSITSQKNHLESLLYFTSLLNSKILSFFFDSMFMHAHISSGYRQYKAFYLDQLPIRRISFTTPLDSRIPLVHEAKELFQSFTESTDPQSLLVFIDARLAAQPEESDVVHDLLAFLAEQMVEMNKEKNAEIKKFLTFIEGEIGNSIDALSNKTLIQEYYANEFTKFVDVLVKNKSKIKEGYNPKSRAHHDTLKDWYDSSVAKLKPLITKIDVTDALIDQITYKLYGLTDEEIKVIEG
jgi:hypothetical protein